MDGTWEHSCKPSREDATRAEHALSIPWSHRTKTLVRGFDFKRMRQSEGPWVLSCPFEISESTLITNFPNARLSYHDGLSCDHLSAGLVRKPARKVLNTPRSRISGPNEFPTVQTFSRRLMETSTFLAFATVLGYLRIPFDYSTPLGPFQSAGRVTTSGTQPKL